MHRSAASAADDTGTEGGDDDDDELAQAEPPHAEPPHAEPLESAPHEGVPEAGDTLVACSEPTPATDHHAARGACTPPTSSASSSDGVRSVRTFSSSESASASRLSRMRAMRIRFSSSNRARPDSIRRCRVRGVSGEDRVMAKCAGTGGGLGGALLVLLRFHVGRGGILQYRIIPVGGRLRATSYRTGRYRSSLPYLDGLSLRYCIDTVRPADICPRTST